MKKIILPILVIFLSFPITVFLLPQQIHAQSDAECFTEYQSKEYRCLQQFNDCTKSCTSLGSVEAYKPCANTCSAQDKTCSEQASTDLTACKTEIPKNKEEIVSEDKSAQDCRKIFDKESYKCLGVSGDCQKECSEETKKPDGGTYFNSGEIYSKCTKANDCDGKGRACNEQALANFRACRESGEKSTPEEAKQETPAQDKKGVNIFKIFELFKKALLKLGKNTDSEEVWKKIQFWKKPTVTEQTPPFEIPKTERKLSPQEINNWIMENDLELNPSRFEQLEREKLDFKLYDRTPQMTEQITEQYKKEWNKMFEEAETKPKETLLPVRVDYIKGDAVYKLPGSDEWVTVKTGDILPSGATLFTGMDSTMLLSMQDKGVFQMLSFTETVISEQAIKGNSFTDIQLRTGEIEASVERGVFTAGFQISTPASTTGTRGTHFWVYYDKNKDIAVTGVYEGEVEVKTKGSNKTARVAPSGDKPGVVVISQKLSLVKLGLVGLVAVAVISGVTMIARRRFASKGLGEKKK